MVITFDNDWIWLLNDVDFRYMDWYRLVNRDGYWFRYFNWNGMRNWYFDGIAYWYRHFLLNVDWIRFVDMNWIRFSYFHWIRFVYWKGYGVRYWHWDVSFDWYWYWN